MVQQHLTRRADWRARLAEALNLQRAQGFTWGRHDCALGLAGGAVEAMTGTDIAAPWRGRYSTALGAARALKRDGFETLGDLVATLLPEHVSPLMARPGDIGLMAAKGPIGEALGVIDVSTFFVLTETGHGHRSKTEITRAFRVGD